MSGALIGLVGFFYILIFIGKHFRQPKWRSMFIIVVLSLLQVLVALYFIYDIKSPLTK